MVNNPIVAALAEPKIRYSIKLSLISCTITAILSLIIAVPIGYLLMASFRETQGSGIEFAPTWTLKNYQDFFSSQANWTAYGRSLGISSAVVFFSVLANRVEPASVA